ncbi:MAG: HupE/UreJ family protein [Nevskia sp.]
MRSILRACFALLLAAWAGLAQAHKASDSYVWIKSEGAMLSGRWDIALRDLDYAIGVDVDGDGSITWAEVKARREAIAAYALARLELRSAGTPCTLGVEDLLIAEHSDGNYASLVLAGRCAAEPKRLELRYALLFDLDAQHRGLLNLQLGNEGARTGIFAPERPALQFERGAGGALAVFRQYLREGIRHVWSGYDHLLFLAGLFVPAVLRRRRGGGWQPVARLGTALRESAGIVTAFTIAHAATLTLAATGAFSPPTRLVESLVAATVLFAGLNNLVPMVHRRLYLLAGGFGLIHGAAIAGALIELGLPASGRVWALLAFNLGIETAQLVLIAVIVPLVYHYREVPAFRRWLLVPSSAFVALAGLAWLVQRAFALPIRLPI